MYKMMLSDLDETLLIGQHVPVFNQEAIHEAKKHGLRFVVATGRSHRMIGDILKEIGTYDMPGEYSICFNGGLVVENKNFKILHFQGLEYDLLKKCFDYGCRKNLCMLVFTLDCCYIYNPDEFEVNRKIEQKTPMKVIYDHETEFLKNESIAKILLVKRDMNYLKKLRDEMYQDIGDQVELTFSSERYLECNAIGINKGVGLKWLADYLNIDINDTIAIGDNYNDVSMIKEAGLGACVSCAHDDIKEISDYVCEKNFDEGAVKEVIETFVLKGA